MNERMRELAKEAGVLADYGEDIKEGRYQIGGSLKGMEKFAESIVRECINTCLYSTDAKRIKERFGVEE